MSRSVYEHQITKFLHQKFGITLYPYPGHAADLQTPCGLNLEVKFSYNRAPFFFKKEQVQEYQFDLAILVNNRPAARGGLRYAILSRDQIWRLGEDWMARGLKGIKFDPPADAQWHEFETD